MQLILIHITADLPALDASDGFLLFNSARFTLGNEPALAADGAQHTALDHLLAEALQQLLLRFIGAQIDDCHSCSPPFVPDLVEGHSEIKKPAGGRAVGSGWEGVI